MDGRITLARKVGERIFIEIAGQRVVTVEVTRVNGGQCGLRFIADKSIHVVREEIADKPRNPRPAHDPVS